MSGRLSGKRAVIVGAGQTPGQYLGNGRAIALRFAQEGAEVFLTARHRERAEETERMIHAELPNARTHVYALDITDEEQVKAMLSAANDAMGGIDILVNNVGIMMQSDTDLLTVDEATYERMADTNLKAAIYLNRRVYPFIKEKGGSIVMVASIAGVIISGMGNMYNLTKAGLIHVGEMFASAFAPDGIRVNTIVLGLVQTAMAVDFNMEKSGQSREEINNRRNRSVPLKGGQGTAWDTANAALFLASDEARFITGAKLPVDGGSVIGRL